MFFFNLAERRKQNEVRRLLRRIADTTCPIAPPEASESRVDSRANRTLPVIVAPYGAGHVRASEASYALTRNLSCTGLALLLTGPIEADEVAVGLLLDGRLQYLVGGVRQLLPLGGGFWQLGVEALRLATPDEDDDCAPLAALAEGLAGENAKC